MTKPGHQPPSHDELLRREAEARNYVRDYDPVLERERAEQAADANRLRREEAFVRTTSVAGHNFRHEHDRGRGR